MSRHLTIEPGYLSLSQAASWAGVSEKTIKRWIRKGLPIYQAGAKEKILIRPTDIDTFLTRKQRVPIDLNIMVEDVLKSLTRSAA